MPINVVFASDKGYCAHLSVAMCSLFENNKGARFDVYIISGDMDKTSWHKLERLTGRYGHRLIGVKIADHECEGLVTTYHFTKANYYRMFIADKLANVSKILYLDADIVVNGSIEDLYSTNIDDYYLAAVINPGFDRHKDLEMSEESRYFNSGVMLLNLAKWRLDHIRERAVALIRRKPWAMQFVDQCAINSVVNGRWKDLHPKFNLQGCFLETRAGTYSALFPINDLEMALSHPIIIHYSGSVKPWHFRCNHIYRSLYWKYLRKTPFNYYLSKDVTLKNVGKWLVSKTIKDALRKLLGNA